MQFSHSPEIWREFPELVPGVLIVGGIAADAAVDDAISRHYAIAAAGIVLAAIVRLGLADVPLLLVVRDLAGLTMVVMAISAATARLR